MSLSVAITATAIGLLLVAAGVAVLLGLPTGCALIAAGVLLAASGLLLIDVDRS